MTKAIKIALISAIISILSACGGDEGTPTAILVPTAQPIEEPTETVPALQTAIPEPTEPPTQTPLPSPTPPVPTETPVPTSTPVPTMTASPTAEAPTATPTETGDAAESSDGDIALADILNSTWLWESFQDPAGLNDLTVSDPDKYSLTLLEDGTAAIQADCNQVSWMYTLESSPESSSGSLVFNPLGPSTLAFCGEESLDQQFLTWLGEVATYVVMGEELFLNLRFDSGNMIFGPSGDLPETDTAIDSEETPAPSEDQELPPDFIEIDLQGLADTYEWEVVEGSPIPAGPGGQGFPNHIVLSFDGEDSLETPYSERRILYAFPIQAYLNLYGSSGDDIVQEQVQRLTELINQAPGREHIPDGVMPLLPPPNSLMDRWVQFSDLNFAQGQGIRYVSDTPFRQGIGVWTNDSSDYYYQGLTDDGRYYISFKWPVSSALLPNTRDDASEETRQRAESSRESYDQYLLDLENTLNATTPAEWSPDLTILDALIASLTFKN